MRSIDAFFAQRQADVPTTNADVGTIATERSGVAVSQH
jgi:hypothetical protein